MKAPRTVLTVSALTFSAVILAGGWLAMAKPPKEKGGGKPISLPVTLTFRDFIDTDLTDGDDSDRILSDGRLILSTDPSYVDGVVYEVGEKEAGIVIRNDGVVLFFNLDGRLLGLDFGDRVDIPGISPSFGRCADPGFPDPGVAGLVAAAVDENGERPSLLELPANTPVPGVMRIGWWKEERNEPRYSLRFKLETGGDDDIDSAIRDESTHVEITRVEADGNSSWFIEAIVETDTETGEQTGAQGVLYRREGKGKGVFVDEGTYRMPFCMAVTLN